MIMQSDKSARPAGNFQGRAFRALKRDKHLFLMFLPILVYYIIFCYLPMPGAVIAFKNFKPGNGIYNGDWVGLKWFVQFFSSPFAYRLIRNTVLISFYSLLFGFPIPILFAICVTEISNMKARRTLQTVSYLPHFISTVVLVGMIKNFLSVNDGIVNNIMAQMGQERINFMMAPSWFRIIYVTSGVWQSFGFSSIIYIAAIMGVDVSLYEAAKIDGINKWQEAWYITLPSISQTIIILLIMQIGRIMSVGFEKVFLMYSPAVYETADVISTYVYRKGIDNSSYSFASAVGLFNSVVNFLFVFAANWICRRFTRSSLW